MNRIRRAIFVLFAICFLFVFWTWVNYLPNEKIRCTTPDCWKQYEALKASLIEEKQRFVSPLSHVKGVLLGGVQRSGINVLRTMLNAHPQLDCSHEITLTNFKDQDLSDRAVLQDIAKTVEKQLSTVNNPTLCVKADFDYIEALSKVLPSVKFVIVIRDGRAVAHSIYSHTDGTFEDFYTALNHWSKSLSIMLDQCYALGNEMCMVMIYEKLVVDTEVWIKAALNFAGLPWHRDVLNHSQITGEDYYTKLGPAIGRLKESIHSDAIDEWRPTLTEEEFQKVFEMAPLLRKLGYPQ